MQSAIARLLALVLTATLFVGGAPLALAASAGLTNFTETDTGHVDKVAGTVTVGNTHGDHFAVYEGQEQKTNDFVLEADVDLVSGGYDVNKESRCAGLIFGVASKNMPGRQWRCVNRPVRKLQYPSVLGSENFHIGQETLAFYLQ